MISRTFKLCLNAGSGSAPYINVNQYDEGETWLFELYSENGERYIPSSGAIVGVKSDGHGIVNTGTVDSEGRVVITETQQMTASAGRAIYELSIDGLTHGTANFIVAVERKPTDDAVMSDSDLSLIQEAIDSAEVIVEVIGDGDPSEVIGEHVDDWLDAHPEATTTVQDGAITAPKINNSLWDKLLVSEEASGNPASFDDGADDVPVSSLKVNLEPIQTGSGDPSPTNIRPINGWTGVNVTNSGKNLIDVNSVDLYDATGNGVMRAGVKPVTLSAGTYTVSYTSKSASLGLYWTNITQNYAVTQITTNPQTFVLNSAAEILIRSSAGNVGEWNVVDLMVEHGNTATEYEEPKVYSVDWTSEAGTVYGGSVDLATGVLTVTHGIDLIDGNHAVSTNGATNTTSLFILSLNPEKASGLTGFISDRFVIGGGVQIVGRMTGRANSGNVEFNLPPDVPQTVAGGKAWFADNPTTICYPLAEPQTIQLTPQEVKTLLGYNNISSSGTVDVIYHADTKLYVDKMTNVDNAIIAPTEADFTATRNYTVNDLVIVNDTLYKVTSNIATGSAITPNSNVQQTTLSALIKALS